VKPEDFDYFHERILHEEIVRCACPGFTAGIGDGHCIGAPPIFQFGPAWMQEEVLPQVLSGKKRICLAISEPQAGSDVANLTTLGKRMSDGSFVVSGTKKWITQGCHADYFVVAVRTGPSGMAGISILLLDRSMEGLRTKPIKTAYSPAAGTALIIMENVKVPARNLIGQYQQGFKAVMYNFNHERWFINCVALSTTRSIIEETFKWIMQRKAFGKRLADQGVVRLMMAQMIGAIEPCVHWLDSITYQMNNMDYEDQALRLAGTTSLCKYQITRVANTVADKCTQLFGGRGITQTGMGRYAERFNRVYKFAAILGGSEEVMADLAIRMAMKQFPSQARL
jgi:alkylation response protein AidB-like acyl-CoA dehydrogenase